MNKLVLTLTMMAVLGVAATAFAGAKYLAVVNIDTTARKAWGSMGGARASADTKAYIGCYSWTTGSSAIGWCGAQTSSGVMRQCTVNTPALMEEVRSISSDAMIQFSWDTTGLCTEIAVQHVSYWAPKAP